MLQRLLEHWLDNASERSYQAPFCQMLIAQGHRIAHSTRHSPVEYGKDVISIAPDGIPHAYQLKGNPGSRITLNQFRRFYGELYELIHHRISSPNVPATQHQSFLVTNGILDEEVQIAINDLNRKSEQDGLSGRRLQVISRGELLEWATRLGPELWPSEIRDVGLVIDLMALDGRTQIPFKKVHALLKGIFALEERGGRRLKQRELRRRVTSAAVLLSIGLHQFHARKNHFAILSAWTMYCCYVIAACTKHGLSYQKNGEAFVGVARQEIRDCLCFLCDELSERLYVIGEGSLAEPVVHQYRATLLRALMAVYWFWSEDESWFNPRHKEYVECFLRTGPSGLWGEGTVPQLLIHYWQQCRAEGTPEIETSLELLLRTLVVANSPKEHFGLPSPYYEMEDCLRRVLHRYGICKSNPIGEDSFCGESFFGLSLLYLVVRTGRKQACKDIWPEFSKLGCKHFMPKHTWQFCMWRCDEGEELHVQLPPRKQWDELVEEARDVRCTEVPSALKNDKFLLMLFVILFPYRATPSVIRYLSWCFDDTWFIPDPVTE